MPAPLHKAEPQPARRPPASALAPRTPLTPRQAWEAYSRGMLGGLLGVLADAWRPAKDRDATRRPH